MTGAFLIYKFVAESRLKTALLAACGILCALSLLAWVFCQLAINLLPGSINYLTDVEKGRMIDAHRSRSLPAVQEVLSQLSLRSTDKLAKLLLKQPERAIEKWCRF